MSRPCEVRPVDPHPDPHATRATCRLCELSITDGRYQRLWHLPVTAPDGPHKAGPRAPTKRVNWCPNRRSWDWSVTGADGKVVATGTERSEAEAHEEADAHLPPSPVTKVVSLDVGGIGDALCAVAVAAGLSSRPAVKVPPERRAWVELFADAVVEEYPLKLGAYRDYANTPRWEWWARLHGLTARLPELKPLPAEAARWAVPLAGRVAIAPFAAFEVRTWPVGRWVEVERQLRALGLDTVILDDGDELRTAAFRGHVVRRGEPANVAAVIRYAAAFAGNDSGMAHVAGFSRTPAVAVCSRASDTRIMDLYPTVRTLGGRARGFESVTPDEVVAAVLSQIRSAAAPFPVETFGEILTDLDGPRLWHWLTIYPALWRVVRELAPKRIVEIGTRAGYSAWTMLRACPDAHVIGFDKDSDEHGGFRGAFGHALKINGGPGFELRIADSHTLEKLPTAEVVYVDGDHSESGALADLRLALTASPKAIILDDVTNLEDVRRAGDAFAAERNLRPRFVPSRTGLYVFDLPG